MQPYNCKKCGELIGIIVNHAERTALQVEMADGSKVIVYRGKAVCHCGSTRNFVSLHDETVDLKQR